MMYPKLGEAYRLRELFMDVFTIADPQEKIKDIYGFGVIWQWIKK